MRKDFTGCIYVLLTVLTAILLLGITGFCQAEENLRYSCSAQLFSALEAERIPKFTKATGIKISIGIYSSDTAVHRLVNDLSDIAGTAKRLSRRERERGLCETPLCKDPLVIITSGETSVAGLTDRQVKDMFAGKIVNWKEVGGPDRPIAVILPEEETAAYQNFKRDIMGGGEMVFDLKTARSTSVLEAVRRFPWSISFIAQGAARNIKEGLRIIKVNGSKPGDTDYPYHQYFSFVTKGLPAGATRKFIDFAHSPEGIELIKSRGMLPWTGPTR